MRGAALLPTTISTRGRTPVTEVETKAAVWQGTGKIAVQDVPEPRIQEPTDATVHLTASAIWGGPALPRRQHSAVRQNLNGPEARTAFYGGQKDSGPLDGLQAEKASIIYVRSSLVRFPDHVSDDQALMLSDIFPTGYFGADLAGVTTGKSVAVSGFGPVGQFAIISERLMGPACILAVDQPQDRRDLARRMARR